MLNAITGTIQTVSALAASYLLFIVLTLSNTRETESSLDSVIEQNYIDACTDLFRSGDALNGVEQNDTPSREIAFAGFLVELQAADDSTLANYLLEMLSIIAQSTRGGKLGRKLGRQLVSASWKVLHTVYVSSTDSGTAGFAEPVALAKAVRVSAGVNPTQQRPIYKCLQDTILCKRASVGRHAPIRQHLLRHWGILAVFPHASSIGEGHFTAIYEELVRLLNACEKEDDKRPGSLDTDKKQGCSIPNLHAASYPAAFETLLHVTVAGMGILSIEASCKNGGRKGRTDSVMKDAGPYRSFESLFVLFHGLVDLYMKRKHMFPMRTFGTLLKAAKHMLSMTLMQVRACVEWRNAQPLLSMADKNRGCYDQGAISFLQALLDTSWTRVVIPILAFCDYMGAPNEDAEPEATASEGSRRNEHRIREDDEDYVDVNSNTTGMVAMREKQTQKKGRSRAVKANSLRYAAERVALAIKDIAAFHNLTTPDLVGVCATAPAASFLPQKRKPWVGNEEGFRLLHGTSKAKQLVDLLAAGGKSSKLPRLSMEDNVSSESGEDSDYSKNGDTRGEDPAGDNDDRDDHHGNENSEDQQDSSEAFGATGNWGEDGESQGSSSSGSLEMETSLF